MSENQINLTEEEKLAGEVTRDFERRQCERRALERSWQLNVDFVNGRQYCGIDRSGEIVEEENRYYWQVKRVFNHIAPIIDTRLAKLSRIRPALSVRAASDSESDRHSACLASAILSAVQEDGDIDGIISEGTMWSEICGTAFYKIIWNSDCGAVLGITDDGAKVRAGNVTVVAVPPFEVYPYSLYEEKLSAQPSIIHAKALPVEEIYSMYGVKIAGRDLSEFRATSSNSYGNMPRLTDRRNYELVIERYVRPAAGCPDGRLTVVAGGKVLYDGELPYINGENGSRDYPFVKQISVPSAGNFFGASVVERLIPLQRAYNALKNRKHEFLNRIAMGTVAVEDGSVDVDELSEDGLVPGKVLIYRQGSTPPEVMTSGSVPDEFWKEEESLLSEFTKIAGTGGLSDSADSYSGITSATGLQLIIEQDEERLNIPYQSVKRALKSIGRHILRLFRQYATDVRLVKFAGDSGELNLFYFKGSDITSDDVVLEADSELNATPAQRRAQVYELIDRGLFSDEDGKLSTSAKNKLLEYLGYTALGGGRDLSELNRARAGEENLALMTKPAEVKSYDDHYVHISEHTAFLLSESLTKEAERRICAHVETHKKYLREEEKND